MKQVKNKQTIDERMEEILLLCNNRVTPLQTDIEAMQESKVQLKELILETVKEALYVNEGTKIGQMTLQRAKEILGMEVEE